MQCKETIKQWTGMPVRVGIAPTKTLSKIASYGAKYYPATQGIVDLSKPERQKELFKEGSDKLANLKEEEKRSLRNIF